MTEPYVPDANEVLFGSSATTAKFPQDRPGTTVGGRIVIKPKAHQEREYDPKNPGQGKVRTFPSGDPIMGITVTVQTDQRDNDDDNGQRRIFIEGRRLKEAVKQAVISSGAPGLEIGGELYITFVGLDRSDPTLSIPPKTWNARYVPAATAALNAVEEPQPVTQVSTQSVATAAPAPVSPAPGLVSGYTAEQLASAGLTPEAAAALLNVNPAALHSMVAQAIAKAS